MKKILALLLAFCFVCGACACSVIKKTPQSTGSPVTLPDDSPSDEFKIDAYMIVNGKKIIPEYVLELDGKKIDYAEFRYNYLNEKLNMIESIPTDEAATFWTAENEQKLLDKVVEDLIRDYTYMDLAAQNSVSLTEDQLAYVKQDVDYYVNAYGEATFRQMLETQLCVMDLDLYRTLCERSYIFQLLFSTLYSVGGDKAWSDEKLDEYMQKQYKKSFQEYYESEYLHAKHILILFQEGEDRKSNEKTLAAVNDVYDLLQEGADFDEMIKTYNEDPGMKANPDGYTFKEGTMVEEFYEGTKALEMNAYSKPILTDYGYHIILRLPLTEEGAQEVKNEIMIQGGAASADFYDYCDEAVENADPVIAFNPLLEGFINHDNVF